MNRIRSLLVFIFFYKENTNIKMCTEPESKFIVKINFYSRFKKLFDINLPLY
jgi:hypothetical protein